MAIPPSTHRDHSRYKQPRAARRWRNRLRHAIGCCPRLCLPLARLTHAAEHRHTGWSWPLRRTTEIVIEGFPRCGNTFAVEAFRQAQGGNVEIAHHLHVPAQVIAAVRRGVPSLVLIRPPEAAIASALLRRDWQSPAATIRAYVRFYRALMPVRNVIEIATFDEVTADFGAVIRRLNTRFGTCFNTFEHTDANVGACFQQAERFSQQSHAGHTSILEAPRPDQKRQQYKRQMVRRLRDPDLAGLMARAVAAYGRFVKNRQTDPGETEPIQQYDTEETDLPQPAPTPAT